MNRVKTRLWIRTVILGILLGAVIYTIYTNIIHKDPNKTVVMADAEAPDFILPNLNGDLVKLSDLRGKAVLVNFWGSWCGPCKREMPALQDSYNQYREHDFEVITINIEESNFAVENYFEENNLSLPAVLDKEGQVYDAYGIYNLPASIFIKADGTVERTYIGEMSRGDIDKWVKEILPK
ncbi:thiol-disulfide oxidoreductase ResA [Metabacillus indicus]|uniref:thiol-disulfide oxidoreductase ResA n=1 Tax=Metabacillus indicus TaxID=246786 RepID=UPI0039842D0A